jgi:tetratricopeptide (TPR) repeat protein
MINKKAKLLKKAADYYQKQKFQLAVEQCKKAIKLFPKSSTPYILLATNEIKLERYELAELNLTKAINLGDSELRTKHLLATVYQKRNKLIDAYTLLERTFNETGDTSLLLDLALTLNSLGQNNDALTLYNKLIELEPNNYQAMFNASKLLISRGDFELGWSYYNARHLIKDKCKHVKWLAPHGLGLELKDKHVLIWPEQGIGDIIWLISCFAQFIRRVKKVSILCDERLKGLLKFNFPSADIYTSESIHHLASIDYQLLAGDLPSICWKSKDDLPQAPVLKVSEEQDNEIQSILKETSNKNNFKIGISWFHGKINDGNDSSLYLEDLLPILKLPNIDFYSLQFGQSEDEINAMEEKHNIIIQAVSGYSAHDCFMKHSALIYNMDIVICASNATVQFAGVLGTKAIEIIHGRGSAELKFIQSPFYKSVYHIGRLVNEDWGNVINYIKNEISQLLKNK